MIILQNISKSLPDKTLFNDLSFKLGEEQKVGLVGPNGVGKTTLLKIITGEEEADSGRVLATNEQIGYLPQRLLAQANEEIRDYIQRDVPAELAVHTVAEALAKVGLKQIQPRTLIAKLSGGQKMKVGLAKLLLQSPTTLLLDEPTNNLDLESLNWLERFVRYFPGKILVISHDRFFLDACVTKIIELDPQTHTLNEYGGSYTQYKEQKAQRQAHQMNDYHRQQLQEKHMKEWIADKQQQLQYHPSNKVARQLQAMKTRYEREIVNNRQDKPQTYNSFKVDEIAHSLHQKKSVITLAEFKIPGLIYFPKLFLYGQDRVHLRGPNGSGKTTLIKSIMGMTAFHTGTVEIGPNIKVGYYSQEHEALNHDLSVIKALMQAGGVSSEAQARSVLGKFLFTKDKVFSLVKFLSEGEKARLLLAIIINQKNDFLLLDEPTNHLDLESREVLATALQEYQGGFLVVSHDRYFIEQLGITRLIEL